MLWPKKNSCKEFDNEKKFLRLENSPPPHNFSNGPSLSELVTDKRVSFHRHFTSLVKITGNLFTSLNYLRYR